MTPEAQHWQRFIQSLTDRRFFRWLATGLGLGIGLFIAAVLIGIVKRVGA